MLCGERNSIDLTEWMIDPEEGPRGPGQISCYEESDSLGAARSCKFEEPNMNKLIADFFGDPYITLSCHSSECLHYSEIPGYKIPLPIQGFSPSLILALTVCVLALLLLVFGSIMYAGRRSERDRSGYFPIANSDCEQVERNGSEPDHRIGLQSLMSNHVPCTLIFRDVSYRIDKQTSPAIFSFGLSFRSLFGIQPTDAPLIFVPSNNDDDENNDNHTTMTDDDGRMVVLEGVQGIVKPGQVMAIMGSSGAGKTTFLDILARKNKAGIVGGQILVNGCQISNSEYNDIIG